MTEQALCFEEMQSHFNSVSIVFVAGFIDRLKFVRDVARCVAVQCEKVVRSCDLFFFLFSKSWQARFAQAYKRSVAQSFDKAIDPFRFRNCHRLRKKVSICRRLSWLLKDSTIILNKHWNTPSIWQGSVMLHQCILQVSLWVFASSQNYKKILLLRNNKTENFVIQSSADCFFPYFCPNRRNNRRFWSGLWPSTSHTHVLVRTSKHFVENWFAARGVDSLNSYWGGKSFDIKRATVFPLGYCLSKHKMTRYARNLGGHGLDWYQHFKVIKEFSWFKYNKKKIAVDIQCS